MTPKPLQPAERRSPEPLTICSFTCRLISSSPRPGMLWATTAPRDSSGELARPMALWPSRARTSHLLKTDALSVFTFSLIPSRGEGGPPERFRPNSRHANRSPLSANRVSANTFRILRILYSRLRDKSRQYGLGLDNFRSAETYSQSLTSRNAARISDALKFDIETGLGGWGARIRTWEWRNQNPLPYHLATPQYRRIGAGRLGRLRNIATGPAPSNVRPGRPAILARQAPYNNVRSGVDPTAGRHCALRATPCPIPSL
jgi:hypothetical protein